MAALRSVVLAGGGTGGHIYPLLAFADCLRRHEPDVRITCVGSAKGLESELIPAGRLRPAPRSRPTSCPARSTWTWSAPRTGCCASTRAGRARSSTRSRPTSVVGFGGYVSVPAYLAAWRRRHADRDPRGQRAAGRGQPAGHAVHQARRGRLPAPAAAVRRRCATPAWSACRCAGDRHARPARRCAARARAHFGLDPTGRRCSSSARSQGARSINLAVAGAAKALHRGRHPGAARDRRPQRAGRGAAATCRRRTCAVPYHRRHGARLRRGRPDARAGAAR